jgi:hypothetical protein
LLFSLITRMYRAVKTGVVQHSNDRNISGRRYLSRIQLSRDNVCTYQRTKELGRLLGSDDKCIISPGELQFQQ